MNILLIAPHPFYQNRGTPIAVKLVLKVLSENNHHVSVLTYPEGEDVEITNCRIIRIPSIPGVQGVKPGFSWKKLIFDIVLLFKADIMVKQKPFDIVHAVEESGFIALFLKKKYGIPFIYDMDSSLSDQLVEKYTWLKRMLSMFRYFENRLIFQSIGVLPMCRSLDEKVKEVDPKKMTQCLEDISLVEHNSKTEALQNEKTGADNPIIMYVGNLEKYQGIDLLIQAFKMASIHLPDARLIIIGGVEKEIVHYRQICRKWGINEKIEFLGQKPVSDLPQWFSKADLLVSPRITGNNTPMKIYSYLDSGKAVLATRLPTHTQVLDPEIAFLVDPDPASMAEGMVAAIKDGHLRNRLAKNAKARVRERYSYPAYKNKLTLFYQTIEQELIRKSSWAGRRTCLSNR